MHFNLRALDLIEDSAAAEEYLSASRQRSCALRNNR